MRRLGGASSEKPIRFIKPYRFASATQQRPLRVLVLLPRISVITVQGCDTQFIDVPGYWGVPRLSADVQILEEAFIT